MNVDVVTFSGRIFMEGVSSVGSKAGTFRKEECACLCGLFRLINFKRGGINK